VVVVLEVPVPGEDVVPLVVEVVLLELVPLELVPLPLEVSELLDVLGAGAGVVVVVLVVDDELLGAGAGAGAGVVTVVVLVSRVFSVHAANVTAHIAVPSTTPSVFMFVCFIVSPRCSARACRLNTAV
jgi:hypothetical protein